MSLQECRALWERTQDLKNQAIAKWEPTEALDIEEMGNMVQVMQTRLARIFDTDEIVELEHQLTKLLATLPAADFRLWNQGHVQRTSEAGARQRAALTPKLLKLLLR